MKPGWKTSEFALTLIASLVGALLTSGLFADGSLWARGLGIAAMVLTTLGYSVSRTMLKTSATYVPAHTNTPTTPAEPAKVAQAGSVALSALALLAFAALVGLAACGWLKGESKAVASDLVDCTTANVGPIEKQFGPVLDQLLIRATGGDGQVDWTSIKSATSSFAVEAGGCVLAAAVARALHPPTPSTNAPASAALSPSASSLIVGFEQMRAQAYGGRHFKLASGTL